MLRLLGFSHKLKSFCYRVSYWEDNGSKHSDDFFLVSEFPLREKLNPDTLVRMSSRMEPPAEVPELKAGMVRKFVLTDVEGTSELVLPNISVDERLLKFAQAGLFMHAVADSNWARFAPNQMVFTNSKTGKTTLYDRAGICKHSVTERALIGYGTADSVRPGFLAHTCGQMVAIDETLEQIGADLFGSLLPALETGKVNISKGMADFDYATCSPIAFLGNPLHSTSAELIMEFEQMMMKVSNNAKAYGSRMGGILFGDDFPPIGGDDGWVAEERTAYLLMLSRQSVANGLKLEKAYKDEKDWLIQPYPPEYITEIGGLMAKALARGFQHLGMFLDGHRESHRHARGMALRLSIINGTGKDEEFDWLIATNLQSLERIMDCSTKYGDEHQYSLRRTSTPEYFAYMLELMARRKSKAVRWDELLADMRNVHKLFGFNPDVLIRKCRAKMDAEFRGCFDYDSEKVEVLNAGVLNIPQEPRFKNSKWWAYVSAAGAENKESEESGRQTGKEREAASA